MIGYDNVLEPRVIYRVLYKDILVYFEKTWFDYQRLFVSLLRRYKYYSHINRTFKLVSPKNQIFYYNVTSLCTMLSDHILIIVSSQLIYHFGLFWAAHISLNLKKFHKKCQNEKGKCVTIYQYNEPFLCIWRDYKMTLRAWI